MDRHHDLKVQAWDSRAVSSSRVQDMQMGSDCEANVGMRAAGDECLSVFESSLSLWLFALSDLVQGSMYSERPY